MVARDGRRFCRPAETVKPSIMIFVNSSENVHFFTNFPQIRNFEKFKVFCALLLTS